MYLYKRGIKYSEHIISTSLKKPSCIEDSAGTPLGLHRIEQKIGQNEKAGTVFFSRVTTEKAFWDFNEEIQSKNLITSRIMWLRGLEPGINAGEGIDSFHRYIYIHGTNHEDRLGTPASGGCVLLSNEEIIRLFDKVPTGSLVYIDTDA